MPDSAGEAVEPTLTGVEARDEETRVVGVVGGGELLHDGLQHALSRQVVLVVSGFTAGRCQVPRVEVEQRPLRTAGLREAGVHGASCTAGRVHLWVCIDVRYRQAPA